MASKPKWEKLRGKIPDTPVSDMTSHAADKSFKQKVDDYKAHLLQTAIVGANPPATVGQDLKMLMYELTQCNKEWDELEDRKKQLNVVFEALGQLILKRWEQLGLTSGKSEDGQTFYRHSEPMVSIKEGQKSDAETWVDGDPNLHYLWHIQPQSLASWVKEKLENVQEDQIPEFIKYELKTSVRVKKA